MSGLVSQAATWTWPDNLLNPIFRTVGPSLATSREPLAQCPNVPNLTLTFLKKYLPTLIIIWQLSYQL